MTPPTTSERDVAAIGREIAAALPPATRHPIRMLDERLMTRIAEDPELRAALFRFVDVAPACRSREELAAHLLEELERVERPPAPVRAALGAGAGAVRRRALGALAARSVEHMAHRFIIGRSAGNSLHFLGELWRRGAASSLDLLGEATLTREEGESYGERCAEALRALHSGAAEWPAQPRLESDSLGPLPRANLSVKLTGLTPLLPPSAPAVGEREAEPRLRVLLRLARELGAHLHLDMESYDTRDTALGLVLRLLGEEEFRDGPSAGVVVQAYLRDSPQEFERILDWARASARSSPLVVRLVKGAYWDQEVALARQHGWTPPVFTSKVECDLNFERLTRALLEARPHVRVAIASHNLRSLAYAIATSRALGAADGELELQVLRGLGDDLQQALTKLGFRVRVYCPVGELVEGMAYLVRRLLENTSNESFVHHRAEGAPLEDLLAPPRA
jgi:proline dehydrogenase